MPWTVPERWTMNADIGASMLNQAMNQAPIRTLENDQTVLIFFPDGNVTPQMWSLSLAIRLQKPQPPADFTPRGTVLAYVNHSRWLANCPFCPGGALPVSKRDPRFWCVVCQMQRNGGAPVRVIFPAEARTIEAILLMREDTSKRNWYPHETVAMLAKENLAHGAVRKVYF